MPLNTDVTVKVNRMRGWFNAFFIVFWSVLCLCRLVMFSYNYLGQGLLYVFIGLSAICFFLPRKVVDALSVSKKTSFYKKLKISWVNSVTQNGALVNKSIRTFHPAYKALDISKASIAKMTSRTYMQEKFHLGLFVFFLLVTAYAIAIGFWGWSIVLMAANIVYNVMPILLQQYIRLRLRYSFGARRNL